MVLVSDGVGYFEDLLDSGDIQTLEIPINLQEDWTFSIAPDTIDLTDYSGNTYQLGFVGIKPKEKIMVGNLNPNCPSSIAMSRNGACQITLKNIGNVVMKGNFTISLDGPQLITKFIFPSNHTEIELNDSTFLFNFPINGLSSFDSLTANFTLFPQAPPGSKIHIIYAYVDDSGYKIDGNFEITIVAPHDPNYIAVDHEKIYKQFISDQKQLSYTVHFQNLGNAPAENVVIKQVVPQELKNDHIYILGASFI